MSITVYTTPTCIPCRGTKRQLARLGLDFEEVDVSQDSEALAFCLSLGHKSTPVVYVNDVTHWSGHRPDSIARLAETPL